MALPEPKAGLVVRYDYLWADEAAAGREHGKDRPTCLIAASDSLSQPRYVVLLPITHSSPTGGVVGVEIPAAVKRSLGLDAAPSWVIVSEHNVDEWPNSGLSRVSGNDGPFSYGFIPPGLFSVIRTRFLALARDRKTRSTRR